VSQHVAPFRLEGLTQNVLTKRFLEFRERWDERFCDEAPAICVEVTSGRNRHGSDCSLLHVRRFVEQISTISASS
jgi:hypothetical protein